MPARRQLALVIGLGLALGLCTAPVAHAVPILFIVAEAGGMAFHHDSYVLPLEDPEDIAHARALIAEGLAAGSTIAVARIAKGADGINRDYLAPGAPPWSWHVTEFLGFADITIEILDGWPGFVEQDVDWWIENSGGIIGFWGYTVVAELGPIPEPSSALLVTFGLIGLGVNGRRRRTRARR
jgi:hypothetical protein